MAELADARWAARTADPGGLLGEWPRTARDDVDHARLALQLPVDEQQGMAAHDAPQARPGVRPERDVDHAGLVLEGEEDSALRRHRVLAGDDEPSDAHSARGPL